MNSKPSRRDFVKSSLLGTAAGAVAGMQSFARGATNDIALPAPLNLDFDTEPLQQGQIGSLNISRMLLGGNLLTHYTHSRDLKYVYNLCAHYNTDEKIMETMALAERHGVNTLVVHTVPAILNTLRHYRQERGGKMQWIICPTIQVDKDPEGYAAQVKELVNMGTEAVYLWGVTADRLVAEGNMDALLRAVEIGHEHGLPSGVGGHDVRVVQMCEEHNIPTDFYIKTFHHHGYPSAPKPEELTAVHSEVPGYWCKNPAEVIETMKNVEKPWIAFKVMAAGAIQPEDAFQYAFNQGADFVLAGMFDFEIEEDVAIARRVLERVNRERPWRA